MANLVSSSPPSGVTVRTAIQRLQSQYREYPESKMLWWILGGPFYGAYMDDRAERVHSYNLRIRAIVEEVWNESQHRLDEDLSPKHMPRVCPYFQGFDFKRLNFHQIRGYQIVEGKRRAGEFKKLLDLEALHPDQQKIWSLLHEIPQKNTTELQQLLDSAWLKGKVKKEPEILETIGQLLSEKQLQSVFSKLSGLIPAEEEKPVEVDDLVVIED